MRQLRPHPWDSTPIDAIERRLAHLRGIFGVLSQTTHAPDIGDVTLSREDLVNLAWLVDDYLMEIHQWADRLHRASKKEVA